ncbi:MAG: PIN domain-containing protein [Deltaproteobacteria bacterium]|nr:PIN domain-containing protein [Deltaproteobacteria bacterium]
MILLDTNALLWLETGHARSRPLTTQSSRLFVSPASLLELQFLLELGRIRLRKASFVRELAEDERWSVDEPPPRAWFEEALSHAWTRDPFDRLIVAHALVRGWKLATADTTILEHIDRRQAFEL